MDLVTRTLAAAGEAAAPLLEAAAESCSAAASLVAPGTQLQLGLVVLGLGLAAYLLLCLLLHLGRGLRTFLLPPLLGLVTSPRLQEQYGPWALVTGAAQGIGREYALALARRGLNIVLVSRNKQELENVANEIRDTCAVDTVTLVAELSDPDKVEKVVKKVRERRLEIGLLVNSVGMMGPGYELMGDMEKKAVKDIITVNVLPLTLLCHALLPAMAGRGRGALVNICSVAGLVAVPHLAVYSATQHYISALTRALATEYAGTGVVIQEVDPGQVATAAQSSLLAPTPATFVSSALRTLGYSSWTCGYWSHALLMTALLSFLPSSLCSLVVRLSARRQYKLSHPAPPPTPPAAAAAPPPAAATAAGKLATATKIAQKATATAAKLAQPPPPPVVTVPEKK